MYPTQSVETVAEVVLYEGYLLYPYTRSTTKNQQRWTFGGVYPRTHSEESGGTDPWLMQTQCLVVGDEATALEIKVRFLHVVDRAVAALRGPVQADRGPCVRADRNPPVGAAGEPSAGAPRPASREFGGTRTTSGAIDDDPSSLHLVDELRVGERVYRPWEEAVERTIILGADEPLRLGDLLQRTHEETVDIPAGSAREPLHDPDGVAVGALVRTWRSLQGQITVSAEPCEASGSGDHTHNHTLSVPAARHGTRRTGTDWCYRVTVRIMNTTPWHGPDRDQRLTSRAAVIRRTFVSTHSILRVRDGVFVSLLEPEPGYETAAAACENIKTWPVLAGERGTRDTLLSSPIILYDFPEVSPQSPGDLFDATEIDELLYLGIMTLSDAEKQEMRESDPRAREILERTESLSADQLMQLHGTIRSLQVLRGDEE